MTETVTEAAVEAAAKAWWEAEGTEQPNIPWHKANDVERRHVLKYIRAALEAALPLIVAGEREWRSIDEKPDEPTRVLYYLANADWRDYHTNEIVEVPEIEAMRFEVGYWDGSEWREQGTNHHVFEPCGRRDDALPTHWTPLPASPAAIQGGVTDGTG